MKILTFDIEDWWGYDYYKLGDSRIGNHVWINTFG